VVRRPRNEKRHLCLDKGYDFPEIERAATLEENTYTTYTHNNGEKKVYLHILEGKDVGLWKVSIHGITD
jgi:hypothetical protein